MPFERFPPDDPREWLNRANSSFIRAREGVRFSEVYLEDLCFDAQQAAEKAIKAVFLHSSLEFPFVHDLANLLTLLEREGIGFPSQAKEAVRLTRFAVQTRYPNTTEPVTQEDYERAVKTAEAVLEWARGLVYAS